MRRLIQVALVASLPALMAQPAATQTSALPSVPYRLDDDSTFQRGCFDPCACPVQEQGGVKGTFRLTPTGSDPLFHYYAVTQVKWTAVMPNGTVLPIQGSGTFKIGGEFAIQEELSLDLVVGTDPVQHFDSGVVVPKVPFPRLDLTISIHGVYCFDTAILVRAHPIPKLAVGRDAIGWDPDAPTTRYDAVRGDLASLRTTGGDFRSATDECVADGVTDDSVPFPLSPAPGEAYWFLVRTDGGSYDDWDALAAPRDEGIDSGPASCP